MNLKQYKQQLVDLLIDFKKLDVNKADNDSQELQKFFDIVYKSGVLNIIHLEKSIQDEYKLELFTLLSSISGALSFLTIQILAAYNETFVAYSLNTVNIELKDFFVKDEDIISSNEIGNYTKVKSASKTVHFCLYGLAASAILQSQNKQFMTKARYDLETIKNKIINSSDTYELDLLRVELFGLVQDIVTTAMILIGDKSILSSQNLQRSYRELIMFNSNGLNDTLKDMFKTKFINR